MFIFFSIEGSFSHLFDSLKYRIELDCMEFYLAIEVTFALKKLQL